MKLASRLVLVITVAGCAADDEQPFAPREGSWYRSSPGSDINTCWGVPGDAYSDSFALATTPGGFTILRDGQEMADTCTLDGFDFTCSYGTELEELGPTDYYTYRTDVVWEGSFTSESSMLGEVVTNLDCIGDDCALFGSDFPCMTRSKFTAGNI